MSKGESYLPKWKIILADSCHKVVLGKNLLIEISIPGDLQEPNYFPHDDDWKMLLF